MQALPGDRGGEGREVAVVVLLRSGVYDHDHV